MTLNALQLVDHCAYTGPHTRRQVGMEADALSERLARLGIARVFASRLEALWFENPHDANRLLRPRAGDDRHAEIVAVPVIDPTLASWPEELDRLATAGPLPMVRLHPNYHGYTLDRADRLLDALARREVIAHIAARVEDPRRQHPRARVPDVAPTEVRDAAARHPSLRVLVSGIMTPALGILTRALPPGNNLWAETAQLDGVDALHSLMGTAWRDRLVFGTNAPLFIPEASLARIVPDLDGDAAEALLVANTKALGA